MEKIEENYVGKDNLLQIILLEEVPSSTNPILALVLRTLHILDNYQKHVIRLMTIWAAGFKCCKILSWNSRLRMPKLIFNIFNPVQHYPNNNLTQSSPPQSSSPYFSHNPNSNKTIKKTLNKNTIILMTMYIIKTSFYVITCFLLCVDILDITYQHIITSIMLTSYYIWYCMIIGIISYVFPGWY